MREHISTLRKFQPIDGNIFCFGIVPLITLDPSIFFYFFLQEKLAYNDRFFDKMFNVGHLFERLIM